VIVIDIQFKLTEEWNGCLV